MLHIVTVHRQTEKLITALTDIVGARTRRRRKQRHSPRSELAEDEDEEGGSHRGGGPCTPQSLASAMRRRVVFFPMHHPGLSTRERLVLPLHVGLRTPPDQSLVATWRRTINMKWRCDGRLPIIVRVYDSDGAGLGPVTAKDGPSLVSRPLPCVVHGSTPAATTNTGYPRGGPTTGAILIPKKPLCAITLFHCAALTLGVSGLPRVPSPSPHLT